MLVVTLASFPITIATLVRLGKAPVVAITMVQAVAVATLVVAGRMEPAEVVVLVTLQKGLLAQESLFQLAMEASHSFGYPLLK